MKVYINGDVNRYHVQMLCMVFFPGAKFSENEEICEDTPILRLDFEALEDGGAEVYVEVSYGGRSASCKKHYDKREDMSEDRFKKISVGDAMLSACGELLGYRPSWGMLIGVRPSKVATEMLQSKMSKTRVKKTLTTDYFVIPKKAALATEVALNEAKIIGEPQKKDCSIYVSIPFCPTRCAYCSFVSYTSKKLLSTIPDYLEKLKVELRGIFALIRELGLNLKTVYIGGGTPTILDEPKLKSLLEEIARGADVSSLEEYTLEAGRPDTITEEKLKIAKELGVGRISVNPQTHNDDVLVSIGRSHNTEQFLSAYEIARKSGIPVINTDLIAGLPGDKF